MKSFKIFALIIGLIILNSCHSSEQYIRSRVVKLTGVHGSCSGTQVRAPSGVDYILTAGHCSPIADKNGYINAVLDGKRPIPRRILEESSDTDLMLLEGMPNLPGVDISTIEPKQGDILKSFTHGQGMPTYKTSAELVELDVVVQIPERAISEGDEASCSGKKHLIAEITSFFFTIKVCVLQITAYVTLDPGIQPGSSGGGVFNGNGELVATVTGSDGHFAVLVTRSDIVKFLDSY